MGAREAVFVTLATIYILVFFAVELAKVYGVDHLQCSPVWSQP